MALDEPDGAPGATTGLHWAAKRCAAAGAPVAALDALGAAESALNLPFRVHVNAVSLPGVDELAAALPLRADTIATKSGALVLERRRTAWLAEPGIGALAYSGEVSASFHVDGGRGATCSPQASSWLRSPFPTPFGAFATP